MLHVVLKPPWEKGEKSISPKTDIKICWQTNCCTTTEKHASYRWATASPPTIARSYWGWAEKTLPACCCHPQNRARPSVRDAEAHSRVPQLSPAFVLMGSREKVVSPGLLLSLTCARFIERQLRHSPTAELRPTTNTRGEKRIWVVLLKLFFFFLTQLFLKHWQQRLRR